MNILLFSSNSPYPEINKYKRSVGGAEINLRLIAEEFVGLGYNVYYFSNKRGIPVKKNINGVVTYHSPILYIPLLHRYIPIIKKINEKLLLIQQKRNIEKIIKKKDIAIIHTYSTYPDIFLSLKVAKKYNIPVVQRVVGRAWYNLLKDNPHLEDRIKWSFENVNFLLFISDFIKDQTFDYLNELGIKIKTPWLIADVGINYNQLKEINLEQIKSKYDLSDNESIILCIASFKYYSKRQDILIKAVPSLIKKFDNLKIIFLGEGPTLPNMKKLAKDLNVFQKIRFLGNVTHLDALAMISLAKVIAHPTDFEGYSNVLKETLALGKPLVVTDIKPMNDIIKEGYNGMLAKNNPESFAEKITYLLMNNEIRESIEKNAAQCAKEIFDSKKNILIYKKIFLEILSKQK